MFVCGIICFIVGCALGIMTATLCATSKKADEESNMMDLNRYNRD